VLEFFHFSIINPNFAAAITAARSQILLIKRKLTFKYVLIAVSLLLLHWVKILSRAIVDDTWLSLLALGTLAFPEAEDASRVTHD
jgi:hypothetical protein